MIRPRVRAIWGLLLLAVLLCPLPLRAEEVKLEVSGAELVKIPVAVPEFAGPLPLSVELSRVARHDLELQMVFRVLGEGLGLKEGRLFSSLGINYLVSGELSVSGRHMRLVLRLEDVVRNRVLLSRGYQGPLTSGRYMVHRFVDLAVEKMIGLPGVSLSRVAYVRRRAGGDELVVQDFDGYRRVRVVSGEGLVLYPRLSPDGRHLAFVSYRHRRPEVHLIDLTTGQRRVLARWPGLNSSPVWHPSGQKLVVTLSKDGTLDLYLLDLSGRILRRLTHGEGVNTGGSFSPDGTELAFVSDRAGSPQIYVLNLTTGGVRRLTFKGRYNAWPTWSPRGDRIVYAGLEGGRFALFSIDPAGGDPVRLTEEGSFEAPCFAPNGRLLLAQGRDGLYLLLVNGSSVRLYQEGRFLFPSWSPLP